MTLCVLFYVLMLLWLVFGVWNSWPAGAGANWRPAGNVLLLFLLFLVLGWQVFGSPVKT